MEWKRNACSWGISQMNRPCHTDAKEKKQTTGWATLSTHCLARNTNPQESKKQEESPKKKHILYQDTNCFSLAWEPGLTPKCLLQIGWNTNTMTSRNSSIICKLTCFTTKEHEHYKCFTETQPPGDLFSEPEFFPKDRETNAGVRCGT